MRHDPEVEYLAGDIANVLYLLRCCNLLCSCQLVTFRPADCRVTVRDANEAEAVCRQRILPARHSLRHPRQYAQHGHRIPQPGESLTLDTDDTPVKTL